MSDRIVKISIPEYHILFEVRLLILDNEKYYTLCSGLRHSITLTTRLKCSSK